MNNFENRRLFVDPYAVEGEERAMRFAHNFNKANFSGLSGVLERWAFLQEAETNLSAEHMGRFCEEVGRKQIVHEYTRKIRARYCRWLTAFEEDSAALAIMVLLKSTPDEFEAKLDNCRALVNHIKHLDEFEVM